MFKKTSTLTLCAVAMLVGTAQADIFVPYGSTELGYESAGKLSGNVGIDYSTKYVSRGMATQADGSDSPVNLNFVGQYALSNKNAIVLGGSINWFAPNGFDHENDACCDEFNGVIEFAHHFSERTVLAGGYQFIHGGIPGCSNYHAGQEETTLPFFSSNRPEEHSLVLDFHHEFTNGMFWDSRVQYSFRWVEGLWFFNTVGYKYKLNEKTNIIASATWSASMGYYDEHTSNVNGSQGYYFQVAAPTMVTEHVRITPHVGFNFIGNGARAAEEREGGVYRDFTFVVGVGASYVF